MPVLHLFDPANGRDLLAKLLHQNANVTPPSLADQRLRHSRWYKITMPTFLLMAAGLRRKRKHLQTTPKILCGLSCCRDQRAQ